MEDGVGTSAEADFSRNLGSIDDIEVDVLSGNDALYMVRNPLEGFSLVPKGVEEERTTVLDALENVILLKLGWNVAGNEIRSIHKIRRFDRSLSEAEV